MTMPWSTPTNATPRRHAIASPNSAVRARYRRASSAPSNSVTEAAITIAASTGWGIACTRPGRNTSMSSTRPAAMSPVSWDFAPDWNATAVRDELVVTGKPVNRPVARLAVPIPPSSWFVSTS